MTRLLRRDSVTLMAYVKLDCGILTSTIWSQRDARDVFIAALLMARPCELREDTEVLKVDKLEPAGWTIPPGWYGLVEAAGPGIVDVAKVDQVDGMKALARLCSPEPESRTPDFDGRRMGRIDGGYIILNYDKYRTKDHTAAERSARYRARKRHAVTSLRHAVTPRSVTQAEAEEEQAHACAREEQDVGQDPKVAMLATAIADHHRCRSLVADSVAEDLVAVMGLHVAADLTEAECRELVATAAARCEDGAPEARMRTLLTYGAKDLDKNRRRRRERGEDDPQAGMTAAERRAADDAAWKKFEAEKLPPRVKQ